MDVNKKGCVMTDLIGQGKLVLRNTISLGPIVHEPLTYYQNAPGLCRPGLWAGRGVPELLMRLRARIYTFAERQIACYEVVSPTGGLPRGLCVPDLCTLAPSGGSFDRDELFARLQQLLDLQPEGEEGYLRTIPHSNLFIVDSRLIAVGWDKEKSHWLISDDSEDMYGRVFWSNGSRLFSIM